MAKRKHDGGEHGRDAKPEVVVYRGDKNGQHNYGGDGDGPTGFQHRLSKELAAYMSEIATAVDDVLASGDQGDASQLASAVLTELAGHEADAATDIDASRVLERLLPVLDFKQASQLLDTLTDGEALGDVATSPYGSHVLERLLLSLEAGAYQQQQQGDDDGGKQQEQGEEEEGGEGGQGGGADSEQEYESRLRRVLSRVVSRCCSSLWDLVMQKYGSFVGRRLLAVLAGTSFEQHMTRAAGDDQRHKRHKTGGGLAARVNLQQRKLGGGQGGAGSAGGAGGAGVRFPKLLGQVVDAVSSADLDASAYEELAYDAYASPFLQVLLRSCAEAPLRSGLMQRLLPSLLGAQAAPGGGGDAGGKKKKKKKKKGGAGDEGGGGEGGLEASSLDVMRLHEMMQDKTASHFMEAVFSTAPPAIFKSLYSALVEGQLLELARHPTANYALQAVLAAIRDPDLVVSAVGELEEHFGDLLGGRRGGVVAALLAACARCNAAQQAACKALTSSLAKAAGGSAEGLTKQQALTVPLVQLLLLDSATPREALSRADVGGVQLSTIGCALLCTLFALPQTCCQAFSNGVAALSSEELRGVVRSPGGCRVVEAFLEGPASAKQRRAVLGELSGCWADMALTMAGSVFTDKCYAMMDLSSKEALVSELAERSGRLGHSRSGAGLLSKLRVDLFSRDPAAWRRHVGAAANAKQEFAKLLDTGTGSAAAAGGAAAAQRAAGGGAGDGDMQGERAEKRKKKKKVEEEEGGGGGGAQRSEVEARAAALGGSAVDDIMGLLMGVGGGSGAPDATLPKRRSAVKTKTGDAGKDLKKEKKKRRKKEETTAGGDEGGGGGEGKKVKKEKKNKEKKNKEKRAEEAGA